MDSRAWGGNAGSAIDSEKAEDGRHHASPTSVIS